MWTRRQLWQRTYTPPVMRTEYQIQFLPPRCYTAPVLGSKTKRPHLHQLRAATGHKEESPMRARSQDGNERPTLRSSSLANKWENHPSELPLVNNSSHMTLRKCYCAQFCPTCRQEDYLTTYRRSYQEWNLSKQTPNKHHDNIKVSQGLSGADPNGEPIEGTTSYNSAFIRHPVPARKKPALRTSSLHLGHATSTCCGHCVRPCTAWTREMKPASARKDDKHGGFRTTTRADFTEHKTARTKPMIPEEGGERSMEPFEGITTMRDHYRRWDLPRRPSRDKKSYDHASFSATVGHCERCRQISESPDGRLRGLRLKQGGPSR